ncbi:hypothetical protein [Hymenobacter sp. CRA2]|uniref:hypothetical protein n=1 Tax=Hymenobacter sp. CRA2 TaxID=1955620 RepID=UPI00098EE0A8|nr:hypothetical protein [Hymenobacter sp. CRA2]OON69759.1 hypothetical protein B0919_07485 [Hymenobacter sp. CRA2]
MADRITSVPALSWLTLVIIYGGLLVLIGIALGDEWSGQASLLALFQVLVAPVVMGTVAVRNYRKRAVSELHKWAAYAGAGYFVALLLLFIGVGLSVLSGG